MTMMWLTCGVRYKSWRGNWCSTTGNFKSRYLYTQTKKATILGEAHLTTNSNLLITHTIKHSTEITIPITDGRVPIDSRTILIQSEKLV